MAGLKKHFPEFAYAGDQVSQNDIDQYVQYMVTTPSVDGAYLGTVNSATANAAVVLKNALVDYPRNLQYSVTGVAGGMGGTFSVAGQDQFGGTVRETVVIGSAAGGGTAYGTAIFAKYGTGTVSPIGLGGTAIGTFAIGFGTVANGSASSNWFGLPSKIGGTADMKNIVWGNNGTITGLNKGTAIGTLVSGISATLPQHAFQGTSGVAITDRYVVTFKPTFDNSSSGTMCAL